MNTTHISTETNRTTGAIECAAEVSGFILRRSYMGYTRIEARRLFAKVVAEAAANARPAAVAVAPQMIAMVEATTAAALIVARGYACNACGATGLGADEFIGAACVDCAGPIAYGLNADGEAVRA